MNFCIEDFWGEDSPISVTWPFVLALAALFAMVRFRVAAFVTQVETIVLASC